MFELFHPGSFISTVVKLKLKPAMFQNVVSPLHRQHIWLSQVRFERVWVTLGSSIHFKTLSGNLVEYMFCF